MTRTRFDQALTAGALALVLSALPIGIGGGTPALDWHAALANNGNGNGGGNANGGGNGNGHGQGVGARGGPDGPHGRGHAYGRDGGQGGPGGPGGYADVDEFVDSLRNGKAFGLDKRDERLEQAKERYAAARGQGQHGGAGDDAAGPVAHQFSPEETEALMARGWKGPAARADGFRNHGERVRTMVELSKRLGYGARVGALQANFGTPQENEIAALQAELAAAEAAGDEAEVERLEGELAAAIADAKPGSGPDDSWARTDLDVNEDGVVDRRDLDTLDEREAADDDTAAG